jgi:hypothetical protein
VFQRVRVLKRVRSRVKCPSSIFLKFRLQSVSTFLVKDVTKCSYDVEYPVVSSTVVSMPSTECCVQANDPGLTEFASNLILASCL